MYMDLLREMHPDIPLDGCVETALQAEELHVELLNKYGLLRCLTLTTILRQGLELEARRHLPQESEGEVAELGP
jgi:hypothetical protein